MRNLYYNFINGVTNLIKWFPTIWKDRNWDQWYIYEILKVKLKFHAKTLKDVDGYVGVERDVEIINTCIKLIDRVQNDWYEEEYGSYYKINMDFIGNEIIFKEDTELKPLTDYFKKYPSTYLIYQKQFVSNKEIATEICMHNERKAKKLLFKLLETNIDKWWD